MNQTHIAFVVESAHGHINPTLGITSRLVERDYRVSYAVTDYFAPRVSAVGAQPKVYKPLEIKLEFFREMHLNSRPGDQYFFDFYRLDPDRYYSESNREMRDTVAQLLTLYADDKPDLVIYDRDNPAGRELATQLGVLAIEHSPMMIETEFDFLDRYKHDDNLVIVSLPKFFQTNVEDLDERFQFVGPIYNDGRFFKPWEVELPAGKTVLVSATTGLLPEVEVAYFLTAARAFADLPLRVVLSIGHEIDPASLGSLPGNCVVNRFSSQQDILKRCCLFVGHGGPLSIFEALRFGVPLLLMPPSQIHDIYVRRAADLGLGKRIPRAAFSVEELRFAAQSILQDRATLERVKRVQSALGGMNGGEHAANLIDEYVRNSLSMSNGRDVTV